MNILITAVMAVLLSTSVFASTEATTTATDKKVEDHKEESTTESK